jgi:hypothetical protein
MHRALSARYSEADDRQQADSAYAERCARCFTLLSDLDAATLFAESLMDLQPWNYWTRTAFRTMARSDRGAPTCPGREP